MYNVRDFSSSAARGEAGDLVFVDGVRTPFLASLTNFQTMMLHQLLAQVVDHDVVVGLDALVQSLQLHQARPLPGQLPLPSVHQAPLGPVLLQQQPRLLLQSLVRVAKVLV